MSCFVTLPNGKLDYIPWAKLNPGASSYRASKPTNGGGSSNNLAGYIEELWRLDSNKIEYGKDYELDLQGYTHFHGKDDYARDPLFKWLDESVFQRQTYKTFLDLLDNYTRSTGQAEVVTAEEKREMQSFLAALVETEPIKFVHKCLLKHTTGIVTEEVSSLKMLLYQLWFKGYKSTKTGADNDSSGFEHVFVGEAKDDEQELSGFHNWIQVYNEEKHGRLDYKGYLKNGRNKTKPNASDRVISVQFSSGEREDTHYRRPLCTCFFGTSPEFEIAVYTLLAFVKVPNNTKVIKGKEVTKFEIDGYSAEIHLIKWKVGQEIRIRTAFPSIPM